MINYDIYVSQGINSKLNLQELIPRILEENNICREAEQVISFDGFIGLDISSDSAKSLWQHLKSRGIKSVIAPSRYRQTPLLTVDDAFHYAKLAVEKMRDQDPSDKLGELVYVREDILWQIFRIFSRKLAEEGRTPSSFFINVDKIDGHLWKDVKEIMSVTLDTWFY